MPVKRPALIVPNVRGRFLNMVGRLDEVLLQSPERGRDELRGILAERVKQLPDESGRFLWADYSLELVPLLPPGSNADLMVAGARFVTYLRPFPAVVKRAATPARRYGAH